MDVKLHAHDLFEMVYLEIARHLLFLSYVDVLNTYERALHLDIQDKLDIGSTSLMSHDQSSDHSFINVLVITLSSFFNLEANIWLKDGYGQILQI
jgi:hypothetical protein